MKRILIILSLFILLFSCKKYSYFSKTSTSFRDEFQKENKEQIDSAYEFIRTLIKSYQNVCKSGRLNPLFYDSLSLMNDRKISAKCYLSTTREFLVYVYKSNNNKLEIYGSDFPVQFYILHNPNYSIEDLVSSSPSLFPPGKTFFLRQAFLHFYDSCKAVMSSARSFFCIDFQGFRFVSDTKIFGPLDSNSIIYLQDIKFIGRDIFNNSFDSTFFSNNGIAVLSGSNDITKKSALARTIGSDFATSEIRQLFIKSEYFRQALANDKLKPVAEKILTKQLKAAENPKEHPYPDYQFEQDRRLLQERIDSFHIKITADKIFAEVEKNLRVGTLFWIYAGYPEYVLQWTLANLCCLFLLILLSLVSKIVDLFPGVKRAQLHWLPIVINGYCIYGKPKGLSIDYWVLPLAVLGLCLLVCHLKASWLQKFSKKVRD